MQLKDYYQILGVDLTASTQEIRDAYHRLAHKYHPDISTLFNCEQIFKEITEAYTALRKTHGHAFSNNSYHLIHANTLSANHY